MREKASGEEAAKIDEASKELEALEGGASRRRRGPQPENLMGVRTSLLEMLTIASRSGCRADDAGNRGSAQIARVGGIAGGAMAGVQEKFAGAAQC